MSKSHANFMCKKTPSSKWINNLTYYWRSNRDLYAKHMHACMHMAYTRAYFSRSSRELMMSEHFYASQISLWLKDWSDKSRC